MAKKIPFNRAHIVGKELYYIAQAVLGGELKGDGPFTHRCAELLEAKLGAVRVLLTPSCTAALELAALLLKVEVGDEVVLPSFTFVSTANAFMLRGMTPRFVDIRPDTLNLDETLIEAEFSERTRVLCPVHYAGVSCEMTEMKSICGRRGVSIVEDAAHAVFAKYRGKVLGTLGRLGTLSFHETKNFNCGEGGALVVNDPSLLQDAEILREKGTDRSRFFRGEVDKYTWQAIGGSFLPSEIVAAFLFAQLERGEEINQERLSIWNRYHDAFQDLEQHGLVRRPIIPKDCEHNAHMYYLLFENLEERTRALEHLKGLGVGAVFHYVPLHLSPVGLKLGYQVGQLPVTEKLSASLIRLPLFNGLGLEDQSRVIDGVKSFFGK